MEDENLQPGANDNAASAADNGQGAVADDASQEEVTSNGQGEDDESQSSSAAPGAGADNELAGDDGEDEDDLFYETPPIFSGNGDGLEEFDIRKLPRNAEGLIDPADANKAINDHINKAVEARLNQADATQQTQTVLTSQWHQAQKKFPHLFKDSDYVAMMREKHLNSIGSQRYLSPLTAAKQIDKIYKKTAKRGADQAKVRQGVERHTHVETTGGKDGQGGGKSSAYTEARKKAMSSDPKTAREGRLAIIRMRREARAKQ